MPRASRDGRRWKLEDAKARFSELVRLARSQGPQTISVRGQDAVVVISVEALERLKPAAPDRQRLCRFWRAFISNVLTLRVTPIPAETLNFERLAARCARECPACKTS